MKGFLNRPATNGTVLGMLAGVLIGVTIVGPIFTAIAKLVFNIP